MAQLNETATIDNPCTSVVQYSEGNMDVVQYLILSANAEVMAKSDNGMTPLHYACL